jgi:hypothetical protein
MTSHEVEIGKPYRNTRAGFDIRVMPRAEYLGRTGHAFALQTRQNDGEPWARPFCSYPTAATARRELVQYLTDVKHPSLQ